jgi:hypothetical protein
VYVPSLPETDAVELLRDKVETLEEDKAKQIAQICECNAQMLHVLAGLIQGGLCTAQVRSQDYHEGHKYS